MVHAAAAGVGFSWTTLRQQTHVESVTVEACLALARTNSNTSMHNHSRFLPPQAFAGCWASSGHTRKALPRDFLQPDHLKHLFFLTWMSPLMKDSHFINNIITSSLFPIFKFQLKWEVCKHHTSHFLYNIACCAELPQDCIIFFVIN